MLLGLWKKKQEREREGETERQKKRQRERECVSDKRGRKIKREGENNYSTFKHNLHFLSCDQTVVQDWPISFVV